MTFVPRLEVLPEPQRMLWPELAALSAKHVLYGGTALALRLGHRHSIDFDFFSHEPLDPGELSELPWLRGSTTLQESPNTRTVLVERGGAPIKVSLFGAITFGRVGEPEVADGVVRVASKLDLAGTKIKALLQRVEAKDYLDVDALLGSGVSLANVLGAGRALFGDAFNPVVARKALTYFVGGDLGTLDNRVRVRLTTAATNDLELESVALASARLD
jgi:Nucleotidyl transferase AbiEii toxin, Type IV TA system